MILDWILNPTSPPKCYKGYVHIWEFEFGVHAPNLLQWNFLGALKVLWLRRRMLQFFRVTCWVFRVDMSPLQSHRKERKFQTRLWHTLQHLLNKNLLASRQKTVHTVNCNFPDNESGKKTGKKEKKIDTSTLRHRKCGKMITGEST